MHRSRCFLVLHSAKRTNAETLTITSTPPGATVELDVVVVGTTPYQVKYPGGYFHKTKTVLGERLEHALSLRVSKDGYAAQEVQLTEGPFEWVNVKGKSYGHYWLLKTNKIEASLQPLSRPSSTSASTAVMRTSSAGREPPSDESVSTAVTAPSSPNRSGASPPGSPSGDGSIDIISDQPGADIYVDGRFVGQTPLRSFTCPAARIASKSRSSPGIPAWQRDLEVLKDSQVTLRASLSPPPLIRLALVPLRRA